MHCIEVAAWKVGAIEERSSTLLRAKGSNTGQGGQRLDNETKQGQLMPSC